MDLGDLGTTIGTAVTGVGVLAGAIWAAVQKVRRGQAETKASVAEDSRDRTVADSQKLIYDMLNERLKTVESELQSMRLYNRKLELHITKLERLMREKGLDVPTLEI